MATTLDPKEAALSGFTKEIEKMTAEQTRNRVSSGENPMETLSALMQTFGGSPKSSTDIMSEVQGIAKTPIETDEKMGILSSLLSGSGLSRPNKTKELGMTGAIDIYKLQQQSEQSAMKAPGEAISAMKNLVDYAKSTGNVEFMKAVGVDTANSEATAEGKANIAATEVKARKKAELESSRESVASTFKNYIELAKTISPAKEGIVETTTNAMRLGLGAMTQATDEGKMWKAMQDMTPSMLPQIRRIAGDVGNATAVEQEGAKRMLIDGTETQELKALKLATLSDFVSAGDKGDAGEVKKVLKGFMKNPDVKKRYGDFEKKYKFLTEADDKKKASLRDRASKAKLGGAVKYDTEKDVFLDKNGNVVK